MQPSRRFCYCLVRMAETSERPKQLFNLLVTAVNMPYPVYAVHQESMQCQEGLDKSAAATGNIGHNSPVWECQ
jgi:hypothetical protein